MYSCTCCRQRIAFTCTRFPYSYVIGNTWLWRIMPSIVQHENSSWPFRRDCIWVWRSNFYISLWNKKFWNHLAGVCLIKRWHRFIRRRVSISRNQNIQVCMRWKGMHFTLASYRHGIILRKAVHVIGTWHTVACTLQRKKFFQTYWCFMVIVIDWKF